MNVTQKPVWHRQWQRARKKSTLTVLCVKPCTFVCAMIGVFPVVCVNRVAWKGVKFTVWTFSPPQVHLLHLISLSSARGSGMADHRSSIIQTGSFISLNPIMAISREGSSHTGAFFCFLFVMMDTVTIVVRSYMNCTLLPHICNH